MGLSARVARRVAKAGFAFSSARYLAANSVQRPSGSWWNHSRSSVDGAMSLSHQS